MYFLRHFSNAVRASSENSQGEMSEFSDQEKEAEKVRKAFARLQIASSKRLFLEECIFLSETCESCEFEKVSRINEELLGCNSFSEEDLFSTKEEAEAFRRRLLKLPAMPSQLGADLLARIAVHNYGHSNEKELFHGRKSFDNEQIDCLLRAYIRYFEPLETDGKTTQLDEISWIGMESVFSILKELSRREPDLCVQALQSIFNALQVMAPGSLLLNAPSMNEAALRAAQRMFDVLLHLRSHGEEGVSSLATSCLGALTIACGSPELIFAFLKTLICSEEETSKNRQISNNNSNTWHLFPKNVQNLCLQAQKDLLTFNGKSSLEKTSQNWWNKPLKAFSRTAEIDLTFAKNSIIPGTEDSNKTLEDDGTQNQSTSTKMCSMKVRPKMGSSIVSDGSFVYILMDHGLLKVGTGLHETKWGEVIAINSNLTYCNGSTLLLNKGVLYLQRRYSSRLQVLDLETLRELGEVVRPQENPAGITKPNGGVIFADGRRFFHASLSDFETGWTLVCTALDDQFAPFVLSPEGEKAKVKHQNAFRATESGYELFGDVSEAHRAIVSGIPQKLCEEAIDLVLNSSSSEQIPPMAFLLTASGKLFYGRKAPSYSVSNQEENASKSVEWKRMAEIPEKIVTIDFSPTVDNGLLIVRSEEGSIWFLEECDKLPTLTTEPNFRKILLPNRCIGVNLFGEAMTFVLDNGECLIGGRHVLNHNFNIKEFQKRGYEGTQFSTFKFSLPLVQIGLGKTHLVTLNKQGTIWTTGLNNAGQCGREDSFSVGEDGNISQWADKSAFSKKLVLSPFEAAEPLISGSSPSPSFNNCPRIFPPGPVGFFNSGEKSLLPPPKVISVSVGAFHTVVLCEDGTIFTFGSNNCGQLGTAVGNSTLGETQSEGPFICRLSFPLKIKVVQVVAGANHSVLRTNDGRLITFGEFKKGQLGRQYNPFGPEIAHKNAPSPLKSNWFAEPGLVPGFGKSAGRIATWVKACRDRTLVRFQRRLLSQKQLANSVVTVNQHCLMFFPESFGEKGHRRQRNYFVAQRDANENPLREFEFDDTESESAAISPDSSFCLDPCHSNLIWVYCAHSSRLFALNNVALKKYQESLPHSFSENNSHFSKLLKQRIQMAIGNTELMVPTSDDSRATSELPRCSDLQMASLLLNALNSLILCELGRFLQKTSKSSSSVENEDNWQKQNTYSRGGRGTEDTLRQKTHCVNRFAGFGKGWGYSDHTVDAIQFKVSHDILLCGIGLYGGRSNEYSALMKLFSNAEEDDPDGANLELVGETERALFSCDPCETACLELNHFLPVRRNRWYTICVQIQGPNSNCGSEGKAFLKHKTLSSVVEFHFRNCPSSFFTDTDSNGTSVCRGQIPEIYFKLMDLSECKGESAGKSDNSKSLLANNQAINPNFVGNLFIKPKNDILLVQKNLLEILEFVISKALSNTLVSSDLEGVWQQERLIFIAISTLRIFRIYFTVMMTRKVNLMADEVHGEKTSALKFLIVAKKTLSKIDSTVVHEKAWSIISYIWVVIKLLDEIVNTFALIAGSSEIEEAFLRTHLKLVFSETPKNLQHIRNKTWWMLALIEALLHRKNFFEILSSGNSDFKEFERKREAKTRDSTESTCLQDLIQLLFNISFTRQKPEEEDKLQTRLKIASVRLLKKIVLELVDSEAPFCTLSNHPPIEEHRTECRFQSIENTAGCYWKMDKEFQDAIAFTVEVKDSILPEGICLNGVGIYSCVDINEPYKCCLEVFKGSLSNSNEIISQTWEKVTKTVETISPFGGKNHGKEQLNPLLPQEITKEIHLRKPLVLLPGSLHAVSIRYFAPKSGLKGIMKTFYGERGKDSVPLTNGAGKFRFFPCSLSTNGTNVRRGQVPFLLYSFVADGEMKQRRSIKVSPIEVSLLNNKNDSSSFVLFKILRLLVQKLQLRILEVEEETFLAEEAQQGHLINESAIGGSFCQKEGKRDDKKAANSLLDQGEHEILRSTVHNCLSYLESRPDKAYDLLSIVDELIPSITRWNNSRNSNFSKDVSTVGSNQNSHHTNSEKRTVVFELEGKLQQIYYKKVELSRGRYSVISFDCSNSSDKATGTLNIYAAIEQSTDKKLSTKKMKEQTDGAVYYLVHKIDVSSSKWSTRNQIFVPAIKFLFAFQPSKESSNGSYSEKRMCCSFRCTVEGIPMAETPEFFADQHRSAAHILSSLQQENTKFHSNTQQAKDLEIEQLVIFLCANACRTLAEYRPRDQMIAERELNINRHEYYEMEGEPDRSSFTADTPPEFSNILRRGICSFGTPLPSVKTILCKFCNKCTIADKKCIASLDDDEFNSEKNFLKDLIFARNGSKSVALARELPSRPFLDIRNSLLEVIPATEGSKMITVGNSLWINFLARDQFEREARILPEEVEIQATIVCQQRDYTSTKFLLRNIHLSAKVAEYWASELRANQIKESYKPTVFNDKVRYQCISMQAPFRRYSFEELRYAFLLGVSSDQEDLRGGTSDGNVVKEIKLKLEPVKSFADDCDHDSSKVRTVSCFAVKWTPTSAGTYKIRLSIDSLPTQIEDSICVLPPTKNEPNETFISDILQHEISLKKAMSLARSSPHKSLSLTADTEQLRSTDEEALTPSVFACLRVVFAAYIWCFGAESSGYELSLRSLHQLANQLTTNERKGFPSSQFNSDLKSFPSAVTLQLAKECWNRVECKLLPQLNSPTVSTGSNETLKTIIKRNALFLLELNGREGSGKKDWVVDLYPRQQANQPVPITPSTAQLQGFPVFFHEYQTKQGCAHQHSLRSDPGISNKWRRFGKSAESYYSLGTPIPSAIDKKFSSFTMATGHRQENCRKFPGRQSSHQKPEDLEPFWRFLTEPRDLETLRRRMQSSLVRSVFLTHSFRVWNWLLTQATSKSSIIDIIWQYVATLDSYPSSSSGDKDRLLLPHPLQICQLAGDEALAQMSGEFHAFLINLVLILQCPSDDIGEPLRELCLRALSFEHALTTKFMDNEKEEQTQL